MALRITKVRSDMGWSMAGLSRRADMSASTIGLIEAGRFIPYEGQLAKIATALGLPENEAYTLLEEVVSDARH